MSEGASPLRAAGVSYPPVIPTGDFGVRGRDLPREERARILDDLFFEGERRVPYLWRFAALMFFSSAIASFGLINDSAAVVIGAMLVAPLMTPILGLSAAIVQAWGRRQLESLAIVLGGGLIGVAVGWLSVLLLPEIDESVNLPGEVLSRTSPNLLDMGIAIAAGAAGAYVTVRKEAGSALPGVGIAVALVPPLSALGIVLGVGREDLADGALLLFLTNLFCITLAGGLVFLAAGFLPRMEWVVSRERRWAFLLSIAAVVAVAVPLTIHTRDRVEESRLERTVAGVVEDWAPSSEIDSVEVDVSSSPTFVEVEIIGPEPPGDPDELAELISAETDRAVEVEVLYVEQVSGTGSAGVGD